MRDGGNGRDNCCYDNDDHALTVKEMPKTPATLHWQTTISAKLRAGTSWIGRHGWKEQGC